MAPAQKPRKAAAPAPAPAKPPNRVLIIVTGVVLGAVWGTVMWGIFALAGQNSGLSGWAYLTVSIAMLGAGVAAFFGAVGATRRGERVTPRIFGRRRR
jgi:TRAP-type C4-dicarboxylate transport system permease small subunit